MPNELLHRRFVLGLVPAAAGSAAGQARPAARNSLLGGHRDSRAMPTGSLTGTKYPAG